MKTLTNQIGAVIGPKLTALAAAGITVAGQVESRLTSIGVDASIVDAITSSTWPALLPAPLAAVIAYFARTAHSPNEEVSGDSIIIPAGEGLESFSKIMNKDTAAPYTFGELIAGEHLPPSPVTDDDMEELRRQIAEDFKTTRHRLDTHRSDINDVTKSHSTINREQIAMRTQFDKLLEFMAEGRDSAAIVDTSNDVVIPIDIDLSLPLNERQNNPGNIEATKEGGNKWKGELPSTNRYAVFEDASWGGRAMLYLLRKYYVTYQLTTISKIIHRWAPLGDNSDASVENYIQHVANVVGVDSNAMLNFPDANVMISMAQGMAEFEGGKPFPMTHQQWLIAYERLVG